MNTISKGELYYIGHTDLDGVLDKALALFNAKHSQDPACIFVRVKPEGVTEVQGVPVQSDKDVPLYAAWLELGDNSNENS